MKKILKHVKNPFKFPLPEFYKKKGPGLKPFEKWGFSLVFISFLLLYITINIINIIFRSERSSGREVLELFMLQSGKKKTKKVILM